MQMIIAAMGKAKPGPELALYQHYVQRVPWKITLIELESKKPAGSAARAEDEARLLWQAVQLAPHRIALDETGAPFSSREFAAYIKTQQERAGLPIGWLIGGADGLHPELRAKTHKTISFGRLTWPHMLMRGLLAEQLYRAYAILHGHPYHRD